MEQADVLYSGLLATAIVLSVWAAALVAATWIFFAPALPNESRQNSQKR